MYSPVPNFTNNGQPHAQYEAQQAYGPPGSAPEQYGYPQAGNAYPGHGNNVSAPSEDAEHARLG